MNRTNPQSMAVDWGSFDGRALSPYYLLRLFSQNVKIATIHPDIMGAIMLTNIKLMISPPSAENTAGS
jgi:hypothetical protein